MNYEIYIRVEQNKINGDYLKQIGIRENELYEIITLEGGECNPTVKERHSLGKDLLSLTKDLRVFEDITIRGPVQIVGEDK